MLAPCWVWGPREEEDTAPTLTLKEGPGRLRGQQVTSKEEVETQGEISGRGRGREQKPHTASELTQEVRSRKKEQKWANLVRAGGLHSRAKIAKILGLYP